MGNDNELINRYIYEVIRRVPKEQRQEIELELQELIGDMQESMTLEQVFEKLGDPAIFAKKYREDSNYVISPEYYDNYIWVLKLVIVCVCVVTFAITVVQCIVAPQDIPSLLAKGITDILVGLISTFGSVTLVFAFMERQKIKVEIKKSQRWNSDMLLPIPDKKTRISRSDCIASIVFIVLFSCLLIFTPELFGASAMKEGSRVNIPVFNLEKWNVILPFFIIGLMASFVNELIRLVTGRYNKTVMWSTIITNGIQFISAVIILKVLPLWNHGFAEGIAELDSDFKMKMYWQNEMVLGFTGDVLSNIVLGVIVFAMILEVGVAVYKTKRK